MMKTQWIHTERATLEHAKELLANRLADLPIWVRWYRTFDGGSSWDRTRAYETCELIGVTEKRLKLRELHSQNICFADPRRCYFATRAEA